jgi:hypothetical protein
MLVDSSQISSQRRGLVIGAVGHRYLPGERLALFSAISRVLDDLVEQSTSTPAEMEMLVSVAEGADRLFIEAAASMKIPYSCVLPCSPPCFESDFDGPHSISEFRRLLSSARSIVRPEIEPEERVAGYLWANQFILDRSDVLVAVWDGKPANGPAGTADSVEDAGERCVPVIWIPTEAPHEPVALEMATFIFD